MYVAMVNVGRVERAAEWAVCWTSRAEVDGVDTNEYHVKLWGSAHVAQQHVNDMRAKGDFAHIVAMQVYRGCSDRIWIDAQFAASMTVSELSAGWFYRSCYERLIGDEVRKVCDQRQDDVHAEATARP